VNTAEAGRKLVVIDRDGVINYDSANYIRCPDDWRPLPGSLAAIATLHRAGFDVVVATNQSGVGRGYFSAETLEQIHRRMDEAIRSAGGKLAGVFVCPHHPAAGCGCRKPKPGLLRQIEAAFERPLAGVPAIGDSGRDLDAALAVGARAMLVRTGNGERTLRTYPGMDRVEVFADLAEAAAVLVSEAP
jgi:D-glycero-D-manno-heptose 1,7-bisphosphate phosphatase